MHEVVIVRSDLRGLLLGGKLVLAGVEVALGERQSTPDKANPLASAFHALTMEVLRQQGMARRFSVPRCWVLA